MVFKFTFCGWVGYWDTQCRMLIFSWCLAMVSSPSSSSFSPAIPVEMMMGSLVSANASSKGRLVRSREATLR